MKKILIILTCILMCGTFLVACGDKKGNEQSTTNTPSKKIDNALVGTWDDSLLPEKQRLGCYWTFNKDGTGEDGLLEETIKYSASDGNLHIKYDSGLGEYDYTYTIKDGVLTLTEVTEENQIPYQYKKK